MALIGTGIMPGGAQGAELTAVTRRAFIPRVVVQIYQATPILSAALANAQTASGGVSSITVPVQGTNMVTAQATDYSGTFTQPGTLSGLSDAEFNLKAIVVPIPFLGMEGLVQLNAGVIPLIEARMNDAGNQIADYASTQLWTNALSGTINIDGFPLMASNSLAYGNIDPAVSTWWKGNARDEGTNVTPTRATVLTDIVSAAKFNGGEMPNIAACSPGTWSKLAADFTSLEKYNITAEGAYGDNPRGARAMFTALEVAGVPIYMDPYAPDGQLLLFNTRYFSFYIHEAAAFAFTGFQSTLANMQLGYIGALVGVLEAVCVKRKSITLCTDYAFDTL